MEDVYVERAFCPNCLDDAHTPPIACGCFNARRKRDVAHKMLPMKNCEALVPTRSAVTMMTDREMAIAVFLVVTFASNAVSFIFTQ